MVFTQTSAPVFFCNRTIGQEVEIMCYVTREPDIPGYSGFYPRINGYITNCTRFCTKVARNFILDAFAASRSRVGLEVLLNRICG